MGADDHNLYTLDAETGCDLWRFEAKYRIFSCPAVAEGIVYFVSMDGHL